MDTPKSMEQIRWWHQVPLKDGRITPGQAPVYQLEQSYLFDKINFRGRSVLDIGCWDGYFSFMAEQRGARRVVGLDDPSFRWGGMDGFNFLHQHFQSSVQWVRGTVFALPEEQFDIVLCYGVLYHLSDPLAALMNCFQKSNQIVVMEGLFFEEELPILRLLQPGYQGDYSNIYALSTGYLKMVGQLHGFAVTAQKTAPLPRPSRWHAKKTEAEFTSPRGAMLFDLKQRKKAGYVRTCFPVPPGNPA